MTNAQIILNAVYDQLTAQQRHEIAAAVKTPAQLAAMAAQIVTTDENGNEVPGTIEDAEALTAADYVHTFQEWKRNGQSVKKGEAHVIECYLWMFTTKPSKAQREAAAEQGKEAEEHPHFYPTKAHLFSCLQVEASKPAPTARFKSVEEIKAYNAKLAAERKAAKTAAEQAASVPAPAAKAEAPAKPTTKPAKKASKPASTKAAMKPATTKKAAQPAPDALHKAERKACAAFLAVPETDRKGQAAALDAWRKARKAEADAKNAPSTPAPVPAPVGIAPVQQLDFESIAAGLLA